MGIEEEPKRTPMDGATLLEGIGRSYIRLFAQYPTRELCISVIAQCYAECGDGAHNCWCWDLGNVQARTGGQYNYCTLHGAWEIVNGARVNQPEHFRAFDSMEEGIDQHLSFLHDHYPTAFMAAIGGDSVGFVHQLKTHGYFSGFEDRYTANEEMFVRKYSALPAALWELEMQAAMAAQPIVPDETEPGT